MKRKGITIWEQHVEHIVLGAAVLFFLGFTAWQIISQPNTVTKAPHGEIAPGEIDAMLRERAEALDAKLDPQARAEADIPDQEPVLAEFEGRLTGSVAPSNELPQIARAPEITGGGNVPVAGALYVEPTVAAPQKVIVAQYFDALDPVVLTDVPELTQRFTAPPYDVTWVTTAAMFNVRDVLAGFGRSAEGRSPIPANWYDSRVEILDVRVEREENVDGQWTNRVTLDPLPGRTTFRPNLASADGNTNVGELRDMLGDPNVRSEIACPSFYDTVNSTWSTPDPRLEQVDLTGLSDEDRALADLQNKIRKLLRDREQHAQRIRDLGGQPPLPGEDEEKAGGSDERPGGNPPPKPPPGGRGGAGGGGVGGGGSGAGGDRRSTPPPIKPPSGGGGIGGMAGGGGGGTGGTDPRNQKRIDGHSDRIRDIDRRIRGYEDELERLGGMIDARQAEDSGDEIILCAHDLTIEPDHEYRYRFTVDVYNPFFGRKLYLKDEQHAIAEKPTLASLTSDWSASYKVIPDRKFWVVKAYDANSRNAGFLGLGHATVEVFRFNDGRWREEKFQLQPGDRIGGQKSVREDGVQATVDFGTTWLVLDVLGDVNADRAAVDRGLGARLLVQSIDGKETLILDPRDAAEDADRRRLKDAIEEAAMPREVADAGG